MGYFKRAEFWHRTGWAGSTKSGYSLRSRRVRKYERSPKARILEAFSKFAETSRRGSGFVIGAPEQTSHSSSYCQPSLDTSNPKRPGAQVLGSFVFSDTTGLALLMLRISSRIAKATLGRPGLRRRLFQVQYRLNPERCPRTTVSGFTMTRTLSQSVQILRNSTPKLAVDIPEPWPFHRTVEDGELLPKSDILKSQLATSLEGRDESAHKTTKSCRHGAGRPETNQVRCPRMNK